MLPPWPFTVGGAVCAKEVQHPGLPPAALPLPLTLRMRLARSLEGLLCLPKATAEMKYFSTCREVRAENKVLGQKDLASNFSLTLVCSPADGDKPACR